MLNVYLLDTDHISIVQRQSEPAYSSLLSRIGDHQPTDFHVAIISFHEQITGWNAYLNRARTREAVVRAYDMFQQVLAEFATASVAAFDATASAYFDSLRASKIRIGTMDLRIAAIALANDWTLLTRNSVDFSRVPNLRIEDWTI
jgi:tRNA(fMet)-specific endonuclease VapC